MHNIIFVLQFLTLIDALMYCMMTKKVAMMGRYSLILKILNLKNVNKSALQMKNARVSPISRLVQRYTVKSITRRLRLMIFKEFLVESTMSEIVQQVGLEPIKRHL